MKKFFVATVFLLSIAIMGFSQLKPGDAAVDFKMENVDGSMVKLSDYSKEKGVILVFTCNECPYSKAYETRIIQLHNSFSKTGYPVVAINSNDIGISPNDTLEKMKERAKEKKFPFVYLKDNDQVFKSYGASKTPHIYLLKNDGAGAFKVAYIGAIDNNAMDEKAVTESYVSLAIAALEKGKKPSPAEVKAIGCSIKSKP